MKNQVETTIVGKKGIGFRVEGANVDQSPANGAHREVVVRLTLGTMTLLVVSK